METPNIRRLLEKRRLIAAPGAMDALTARVIEAQGFPAVYLGGNAMGLHLGVGQPFVTLSETADCVRQVTAAVSVPLIVDAGAGFGSAAHAHRATRILERAGASALHFDDQPYPKRARYHLGDGGLAPVEETAAKLTAAVAARRSADFLVFARTDALRVTDSLDDTIERCHAYARAGADGLMILDLSPEQLIAIRPRLPAIPVAWFVSPATQAPSLARMEEAGFSFAFYPFNTVAAIVDAVSDLWRALRETGEIAQSSERLAALRRAVQDLIGMDAYWALEKGAAKSSAPETKS